MAGNPHPSPATRFKPGSSGNPKGRAKARPITDAIKAELKQAAADGARTNLEALARRLVHLAVQGDVSAAKLILAYVEGQPLQRVELELRAQAERMAAQIGCSAETLLAEAEAIAAQAARRG